MATTGPSTPDSTPRKGGGGIGGRSFSTPAKMRGTNRSNYNTPAPAAIGEAAGIETLYTNANGKVVKFSCASGSRPSSSAGGLQPGPASGSLPWATRTEQTLASGPLEIYRVPGSVSFLHSGSLLHAILPRSNCWCVDGVSKFAMRVLTDTYYRIELPGETQEELARVEEFKATLKKVLFYERTACPFARTFEVPLPEEHGEERVTRKRRNTAHGPAKKWKLDRAYSWKPEDGKEPPQLSTSEEEESGSVSEEDVEDSRPARVRAEADSIPEDAEAELEDAVQELKITTPSRPSVRDRVNGLTMRSVTAPPQLSLHSTPPSRLRSSILVNSAANPQMKDTAELRLFQAIPTDMPPSPPDSSAGFEPSDHITHNHEAEIPSRDIALVQEHREGSSLNVSLMPNLVSDADQLENEAEDRGDADADAASMPTEPQTNEATSVNAENVDPNPRAHLPEQALERTITNDDCEETRDRVASLPAIPQIPTPRTAIPDQTSKTTSAEDTAPDADPFAQIQARIQARRSIGGTTTSGFVPHPRQTSTSTQGASPPSISSAKTLSHKSSSISRHSSQQHQYLATALVKKACAVFLGPPAHLVVLMLRIAARFAKGVFPKSLLYESPRGERRRVPGSFNLNESDDDYGLSDDDEPPLDDEEWEDDFGVPIDSPVRLSEASGLREKVRWDVD